MTAGDDTLHRLLDHPPLLHVNEAGELTNFQIDPKLVPFLRDAAPPGTRSMETGAGLSTIVMLLLGARHTSISPDAGEGDRIREYCDGHGIEHDAYTHVVGASEDVLPTLTVPTDLDLIIVDGNHAFPAPFIDWFYMTRHLRTGGVLVVDDVELWTGRVLADFLDGEKGIWEQVSRTPRFAVYRLEADRTLALTRGWQFQPHVRDNSDMSVFNPPTERSVSVSRHQLTTRASRIVRRTLWKLQN